MPDRSMNTFTHPPEVSDVIKPARTINVLIVDDRPENIVSLENLLEHPCRKILKASSGNEALKLALQNDIAVMLLDVQMPDMDGFEVAKLIKENPQTRDISIIFVTALSTDEKYAIQGYDEGAVDYLHKPLDPNLVKAKIKVFEQLHLQRLELAESNHKLSSINKQLDEFVYIVSHDLKAPLRGLSSLCTFLEEELGDNPKPEITDLLKMMISRTGRMQGLIDGILHYSRMANVATAKEDVDVKPLITNVIDLLDPPSHLKFDIQDSLPVFQAERVKLHEVFQNLIGNAIKYNNKPDGTISISHLEYPDHFEFMVKDTGCGIKPEHHDSIFKIFHTLLPKDKTESTGIGLTIVKKIVENQGGKVSVDSVIGEGSTFRFTWMK